MPPDSDSTAQQDRIHNSAAARLAALPPIPPEGVLAWLDETYKPDGRAIWLREWFTTDDAGREWLTKLAHTDPMGT